MFMCNKEFIGRPIPDKRNETKAAPEPEPGTRRKQKIMMEHNPFPEKGNKRQVRSRETSPGTLAKIRRDQEIMMDKPQNPTRNQKEAGNDDGTQFQKSKETSP